MGVVRVNSWALRGPDGVGNGASDRRTDGQTDRQRKRERQKAQGVRQGCPGREVMLPHVYLQTDRQTKHKSEDWQRDKQEAGNKQTGRYEEPLGKGQGDTPLQSRRTQKKQQPCAGRCSRCAGPCCTFATQPHAAGPLQHACGPGLLGPAPSWHCRCGGASVLPCRYLRHDSDHVITQTMTVTMLIPVL